MIHALQSILFPPRCIACRASRSTLCSRCIKLSRKSLQAPVPYAISAFDYRDPVIKKCIHAIKYYRRKDLIEPLTRELAKEATAIPNLQVHVLVPIPMPRIRRIMRGYNQAELIAQELGKQLHLPVQNLLTRSKTAKRQVTSRTRQERLDAQKGTFSVTSSGSANNLHIILVDDVTTTGATLEEARKVLLKQGAQSVRGLTLAH